MAGGSRLVGFLSRHTGSLRLVWFIRAILLLSIRKGQLDGLVKSTSRRFSRLCVIRLVSSSYDEFVVNRIEHDLKTPPSPM